MADDRRLARQPSRSAGPRTADQELRRILRKLFALYPLSGTQDPMEALEAYRQALCDVPPLAVSHGVHRLTQSKDRRFVPAVGEIRAEAVRWLRRHVRAPYNPQADEEVNDRKVLQAAQEQLPELMAPEAQALIEATTRRMEVRR